MIDKGIGNSFLSQSCRDKPYLFLNFALNTFVCPINFSVPWTVSVIHVIKEDQRRLTQDSC